MADELVRPWDSIPIGYSIYRPQDVPGWGAYIERCAVREAFQQESPAYGAWVAQHVPVGDVSRLLKILPVTEGRRSSRRTAAGVSFTITQPLASYLADPSDAGMARCADSDAAVFDALMTSRWSIPSPPPLDLPPAEDAPSWTRLGRLLISGEEPHHVIDLWRRGELPES